MWHHQRQAEFQEFTIFFIDASHLCAGVQTLLLDAHRGAHVRRNARPKHQHQHKHNEQDDAQRHRDDKRQSRLLAEVQFAADFLVGACAGGNNDWLIYLAN